MSTTPSDDTGLLIGQVSSHLAEGRLLHALASSSELLQRQPAQVVAWKLRGDALSALNRVEDAAASYARALELSPEPRLYTRLGRCMVKLRQDDAARACFNKALELDPGAMHALKELAGIAAVPLDHPLVKEMKHMLGEQLAPADTRAFAAFLLGRIEFQAGKLHEAFNHYQLGNQLVNASSPQAGSEQEWLSLLALDHSCFAAAKARAGTVSGASPPVVLVVGLPRSGKSLVEFLLASHPDFAAGGELAGIKRVVGDEPADPVQRAAALSGREAAALREFYEAQLAQQLGPGGRTAARIIIDTSPGNLSCLGYLGVLAPQVPVVLCERDPLDLGAALYFKKFRSGHAYSFDLERLGKAMAHAERLIAHWALTLPNPVLRIRYEEMVFAPNQARQRLLHFLGRDLSACDRSLETGNSNTPLHPSHTAPLVQIRSDLVGFSRPLREQFAPMMQAYRQTVTMLRDLALR
jgi:tetratricopeptide (TPR) repeat protein